MKNEYFYLGHITKSFGIKGQLSCYFDTDEPEKYADLDAVFIDLDGEKLPYLIENIQYRGANTFVIKFQDVDEEESKSLIKAELYLPMSELPPLTGNRFYFHEVIGFTVADEQKGEIGTCREFLEVSNNPIMVVAHDDKEILIPASQQFVTGIDRDNRILHIQAPEGLIDMYLQ